MSRFFKEISQLTLDKKSWADELKSLSRFFV